MRGLQLGVIGALALAGCDDGVVIEVRTPGATDNVELFLGIEECFDCPGVSPSAATGSVPLPGHVYFRDDSKTTASRYTRQASGGVASFHIKPSDLAQEVLTLAVFAEGAQVSATIVQNIDLSGGAQHLILELAPAQDMLPPPVPPDGNYVAVWEQANTSPASACFAFEQWRNQEFQGRAFIVPKQDPDCDGILEANECNPYVANGTGEPEIAAGTACLVPQELANGTRTCRIGGPACSDADPSQTTACAPSSYCIPNAACATCDVNAEDPVQTCLPVIQAAKPRLVCKLPVLKSDDATHLDACPEARTFAADLSTSLGIDCVFDDTPFVQVAAGATFAPELKFPTTVANGSDLFLKLKHEDRCQFRIDWDGSVGFELDPRQGFVRFVVEPAGQPTVRLLMPIELQLVTVASCETEEPACELVREDALPDLFGCLTQ